MMKVISLQFPSNNSFATCSGLVAGLFAPFPPARGLTGVFPPPDPFDPEPFDCGIARTALAMSATERNFIFENYYEKERLNERGWWLSKKE
jgi:hypothetical protein